MSTEYVPPTPTPAPRRDGPSGAPGHRTAARVIAILTASLGAAVLVGSIVGAAWPTFAASTTHDEQRELDVDGVTSMEVDAAAMSLDIVFADVDRATLEVRDATAAWTFETDGDALRVATPREGFVSWFRPGNGHATLTLPEELAGLDADLRVGGGSLDATGEFGELDVDLGAGEVIVRGEARSLGADISAGRGDIDLAGVSTADLSLGAGELITRLTGEAPQSVTATVSAGSMTLTLPDEVYDVTSTVSAGDIDNRLRTADGASSTVNVEVSAGDARLLAD